ncbi:marvel domain-containing protein [Cladorrhinum sp. PSN332]|nr:marvel domain-containing protein [Cladorrhinum sp. PSN332]
MSKLLPVSLGLRAFQFLLSIVVLALSITLIRGQVFGSAPVTTKYSAFTGGFGVLVSAVGAASLYLEFIPNLAALALDGLSGVLYLGGGIAWAIALRATASCSNYDKMLESGILNGGTRKVRGDVIYGIFDGQDSIEGGANKLKGNCTKGLADQSIQFISFGLVLGLILVGWLALKRGGTLGKGGSYV